MFDDTARVFSRAAELERMGLTVPAVTRVCMELKKRGLYPLFITGHTGWTDNMEFAFAHKNELCSPFKQRAHSSSTPCEP